jgi:pimeloyl-ACP methyl ester carboxylesterase
MTTYVLIHGGWQGGDVWSNWDGAVAGHLIEGCHHAVLAPTLIGCEPGARDRSGTTLTTMAAGLAEALGRLDADDLTLVGHSGGGPVAQVVAGLDTRVRQVVFVDAWVLHLGENIADVLPAQYTGLVASSATRPDQAVPMDRTVWDQLFCGGLTTDPTLFRPLACPVGWLTDSAELDGFWRRHRAGLLSTGYVHLSDDVTAPGVYERMAARLYEPRVTAAPGPHEAMLTHPAELAVAILAVSVDAV